MKGKIHCPAPDSSVTGGELRIISEAYAAYLREHGYAKLTVHWYQGYLERASRWLVSHGRSLATLTERDVLPLARELAARRVGLNALRMYRAALRAWLRSQGRTANPDCSSIGKERWSLVLADYDRFLASDQGLAPATRYYRRRYARCFLAWQFRSGELRFESLSPADIWRFAERFSRGLMPASANVMLYSLKSLLRFLHLRGMCPRNLVSAVPHFANYGQARRTEVLSFRQRTQLLAAFSKKDPRGVRDRAIALCLLDLGLRAQEVANLDLSDLDFSQACLRVPAVKGGRQRQLPLPPHVTAALLLYVTQVRPDHPGTRLFLRHRSFAGQPFSLSGLRQAMRRAFRRCGFPRHWTGTHRLRHTFATRLYHHGTAPKQIADLLGHRDLTSTNSYVQSDLHGLRALTLPWPTRP